ncbi:MAG: glutaredoxin family protein [Woeseia sp.]
MSPPEKAAPVFQVYSRAGCHLCEVLIEELLAMARGRAEVEVFDVDTRQDWRDDYGLRVPVVELGGRFLCQFELDRVAVKDALSGNTA